MRTRRSPRNPPESLVGRQGLEPWTLGLRATRGPGSASLPPLLAPGLPGILPSGPGHPAAPRERGWSEGSGLYRRLAANRVRNRTERGEFNN